MTAFDRTADARIRSAAFEWLGEQCAIHGGEVLPYSVLKAGFTFLGQRVHLVGPQGIFKPKSMSVPLSIRTAPHGPYNDAFGSVDHLLRYKYRGGPDDVHHRDNVGLRFTMSRELPLVYLHGLVPSNLHGVVPSKYLAVWPVHVVGDDPGALTFSVDLAAKGSNILHSTDWDDIDVALRRRYASTLVQRRLHQGTFRELVLRAYRHQCALCRLRHDELLDAAHIIPDSRAGGAPQVNNGLALCRLHHAAFDRFFVGIRPDYTIEVRPGILCETDGPTLRHAIQGLHGQRIEVPRLRKDRPAEARLEERYRQFRDLAEAS